MTQPPIPYSLPQVPPTGYWLGPADALLSPARRASWLMIAVGALSLCCGICIISAGVLLFGRLVQELPVDPSVLDQLSITKAQFVRVLIILMITFSVVAAFAFMIVGAFVRRGGLGWIIVGMIVTAAAVLLLLFYLVTGLIAALKGDPNAAVSVLIVLVLLGTMGLLFYWLIQAARATGPLKQMQLQQQQQWYAMQQQYFASQR